MSNRWLRFYDDALDDPKVQRLSGELFKTWVNMLCLASKGGGTLPSFDDIAFRLRISVQDAEQRVSDLILAGLIDIRPDGTRTPHNWEGRQFASDSSAERMRKHRAKKRKNEGGDTGDTTRDVTVTAQSQSRADTETDSYLVNPLPPSTEVKGQQDLKIEFEGGRLAEAKASEVRDHTIKRAEQLGLPIDEIIAEARAGKPNNLDAYVQAICRRRLKQQLPTASDEFLREAFKRSPDAYQKLLSLLSMVP